MVTGESSTEMAESVETETRNPLRTTAERKLLQDIPAYTAYNKSAPSLSKNRRRTVNSTIKSFWYGREPNIESWKYSSKQDNLKAQENNLLLHFFSFHDLNKTDVEAVTSLYNSTLDSI